VGAIVRTRMPLLELSTEDSGQTVRLALRGELDISSTAAAEAAFAELEQRRPEHIVLDLRALRFMDSTGLRAVVNADVRAREQGRRLTVVRGPEPVQRVFDVTGIAERLDIVDDPAALAT